MACHRNSAATTGGFWEDDVAAGASTLMYNASRCVCIKGWEALGTAAVRLSMQTAIVRVHIAML